MPSPAAVVIEGGALRSKALKASVAPNHTVVNPRFSVAIDGESPKVSLAICAVWVRGFAVLALAYSESIMRRFPAIVAVTAAATACALLAAMPSVAAPVDPDTSKVVVAPKFSSSPVIPSANEAMLRPYSGLGTWADVYDWSRQYGGAKLGISDIDAMAKAGVQTLFIQTTKYGSTGNVLEPARLKALIRRAHNRGMSVVAWYLPSFVNEKRDFFKMNAMLTLGIDGITVDIESTANKNVPSRNAALIRLLKRLDVAIRRSGQPIAVGAATYTPH
ncbi:MAG: hypothetical protein EBS41_08075, partial [Actinobacteria bacterium]|nr:hypothetical protein [Actinomycetota bacterium]